MKCLSHAAVRHSGRDRRLGSSLCILLAVAGFTCIAAQSPPAGAEVDTAYINEVRPERLVTPAEPFAKDYARGPVRALFVTPLRFGASREIVELQQRFDLEFDAVTVLGWRGNVMGTTSMFAPRKNTSPADKNRELYEKLGADWDVVVLASTVKMGAMDAKVRYRLMKAVSEGTGLLVLPQRQRNLTNSNRVGVPEQAVSQPFPDADPAAILAGVPFDRIESYRKERGRGEPEKMLQMFRFGKGRIASLMVSGPISPGYSTRHSLTPIFPYDPKEETYYKYCLSAFAKALVWAAQKESPVLAAGENPQGVTVAYADLPGTVKIGAFEIPDGVTGTVHAELRGFHRPTTALGSQPLRPGRRTFAFEVPKLARGDYFIDYRFETPEGVEYWGSVGLAVRKAPARIRTATLPAEVYRPDEALSVGVTIEGDPAGLTLDASVFDLDDREVIRLSEPVTGRTVHLAAPLADTRLMPHRLVLRLKKGDGILDVVARDFVVIQPMPPFYSHVACPRQPSLLGRYAGRQLRKAGFGGSFGAGSPPVDMHGAIWSPNNLRIGPPSEKNPQATYADPVYLRNNAASKVVPTARSVGPYIDTWTLGDEQGVSYVRPMVADAERRAFQQFLRQTYEGDLALLNKEFARQFESFDAIGVPDVNAMDLGDVVYKHLWMHFVERLFTDTLHTVGQMIQDADPDPDPEPYGLSGTTMPDLDMLHGFRLWHGYPSRVQNVAMRSFMPDDSIRGNWWGGYMHSRRLGARPLWDLLLKGGINASYYWSHGAEGMLAAELSFAEYFQDTQYEAMKEIHGKLGPLLRGTPVAKTGVGVYYSKTNEHVHSEDVRFDTPGAGRDGLAALAERVGVPIWFYSDRTIEAGTLETDEVKVLFLTQAEALPDRTIKKLERWVRDGGLLVADMRMALRNGRGAPRQAGAMDELFGVEQSLQGRPVELKMRLPGQEGFTAENMIVDASVKAAGAEPGATVGDGVPVMLRRSVGEGEVVFMNMTLGRLLSNYGKRPEVMAFIKSILADGGVWTGLEAPEDYFVTRFGGRGYDLLTCRIRGRAQPGQKLQLGRVRHVYDIRNGESLGKVDSLVPSDHGGAECVFTVMAEPLAPFAVKLPETVAPGRRIEAEITPETGEQFAGARRLFRVRVLRPDGPDPQYIRRLEADPAYIPALQSFVWSAGQPARVALPIAHNRRPGRYTLEVLDVLSGRKVTSTFEVRPR